MRKIVIIGLVIMTACSWAYLWNYYSEGEAARQEYASYVEGKEEVRISADGEAVTKEAEAGKTEDAHGEPTVSLPVTNEKELSTINPHYRAWLYIPDTPVNYPVAEPRDNETYLTKSFDGTERSSGCLFFDGLVPAYSTPHLIIYGHNMKDGSMFGALKGYRRKAFAKAHDRIYLKNGDKWEEYRLLSVYETDGNDALTYRESFLEGESAAEYAKELKERSEVDTGDLPYHIERILTLSTCSKDDDRLTVHFVN